MLFAGSSILSAGIYAAERPFTATLTQLLGMAVTVVGLFVFLRTGGVTAAALVSSAAYATVFVATLVAYKRVSGKPWRFFVPSPAPGARDQRLNLSTNGPHGSSPSRWRLPSIPRGVMVRRLEVTFTCP